MTPPKWSSLAEDLQAVSPAQALYDHVPLLRWCAWGLRGVQCLAPRWASVLAQRVFLTPPVPVRRRQRQSIPATWRARTWRFEGRVLTVYTADLPPAANPVWHPVLLAHGWGGSAAQWLALVPALLRAGYWPVMVDMPGHGRSGGGTSSLPQFIRALQHVAVHCMPTLAADTAVRVAPTWAGLIAHSLGATAAAVAVAQGLTTGRLVLLAPLADPVDHIWQLAALMGMRPEVCQAMLSRIERLQGMDLTQLSARVCAPSLALPTLVVHDQDDRVNPHADGVYFAGLAPGGQLLSTHGLGHRKLMAAPGVHRAVVDFLNTQRGA